MKKKWSDKIEATRQKIQYLELVEKIYALQDFFNQLKEIQHSHGAKKMTVLWIDHELSHQLNLAIGHWIQFKMPDDEIKHVCFSDVYTMMQGEDTWLDKKNSNFAMEIAYNKQTQFDVCENFDQFISNYAELCPTYLNLHLEKNLLHKEPLQKVKI